MAGSIKKVFFLIGILKKELLNLMWVKVLLFIFAIHIKIENKIPAGFSPCACLDVRILCFVPNDVTFEEEGSATVCDILNWQREFLFAFFAVEALSWHVPS